uniref:U1-type domain-containing protein n=1 Tax=Steinernema glaseri TaxID=37863 RepID=A0A1I7ZLB1_9BILA
MSATEQMAAMLNELMGPKRNAEIGSNTTVSFQDPEVCKFFLAAYCPHEMFVNTKADLGPCTLLHDEGLRKTYRESSRFERLGYEKQFLQFISRLHDDMQRKIGRNRERLQLTQSATSPVDEGVKAKLQQQINDLDDKINGLMQEANDVGETGEIERAQEIVAEAEQLKNERESLKRSMIVGLPSGENSGSKPMEVCDVCGCFLIIGDVQQRIDEHFTGKQHVGFAKLAGTIEEMKARMKHIEEQERKHAEERRKRDRERDRDRRRDREEDHHRRRSRSRSRDRSRRSGHRDRRSRSRSPSYRRHRNDRNERDSARHRSRY